MLYSEDNITKYQHILGINLISYLADFISFINLDSNNIIDYYSGKIILNENSFNRMNKLINNYQDLINLISINKSQFKNLEDWEILEELENIYGKLISISNISKFLRSFILKGEFNLGVTKNYSLKYQEALEDLSFKIGDIDPQNNWSNLSLKNDLIEEDYTPEGGSLLKVNFTRNTQISEITNVIDNIDSEEKINGIDINQQITFENNDLQVLSYDNTLNQSINIMLNLKKEDNPEFPDDGYEKNMIGGNLNSFQFPIYFRQLSALFKKDDSINSLVLKDIKRTDDSFNMEFEIESKINSSITKSIPILE